MEVQAGPSRTAALCLLLLAAGLVAVGATSDVGGAVLALPASAVAAARGLRDLLLVPVLRADREGLSVVQGLRRLSLGWTDVAGLRTVTDRGAVLLELDLTDQVVVLSRGRLGRDPRDVLEELERVRP